MTSFRPRDFVLARVVVLEVMTDLQPYRFEPESVANAEDSENEEVNDRLEGTFWVTCERCETMPTQIECVCCREQPESENKMEGIILSLYYIGRSQWKNSFLCKLL